MNRDHGAALRMAAIALVVSAAFGCGKEPTAETTPSNTRSTTVSPAGPATSSPAPVVLKPADLAGITKAREPYKIMLIVKTLNNPFFKPMVAAFRQAASELGAVADVQAAPQETDVDKQAAIVQAAAAQGFNAICITPADSKALVPVLRAAAEKGVLIVNVDNRLDPATVKAGGLTLAGYVGADNMEGGKLAGEALLTAMGGKGNAVVIEGIRGVDNAEARKHGFEEAVKGHVTILDEQSADWMTEKARSVAQNLLAAHPDINGIFCANDEMAIGAIKAIEASGRTGKIKVVSYDNIKEVQPYLKTGELSATIEQHPDQMGSEALRLAVGVLDGKIKPGGDLLVNLDVVKK